MLGPWLLGIGGPRYLAEETEQMSRGRGGHGDGGSDDVVTEVVVTRLGPPGAPVVENADRIPPVTPDRPELEAALVEQLTSEDEAVGQDLVEPLEDRLAFVAAEWERSAFSIGLGAVLVVVVTGRL
jgi:hypothetical protein